MSDALTEAQEFWDTHCVDCAHDLHPMNVCSTIVGGDTNGPDYCPCALDYPALASAYQRGPDVERLTKALYRVEADPDFISLPRWDLYFGTVAKRIAAEYRALGANP